MSARPVVCFLTGTLDALAGAERVTAVVASALAARGYTVHVLALWGERSCFPLHPAVHLHALHALRPSFKRRYVATVRGIRAYLKQHGIEVLVGVDTMLAWFTAPAALGLPVRQIAWEHCNFDEDLGRRSRRVARRLAASRFDAVVVLTERDRARWIEALSPRAPIVAIANPLPFEMGTEIDADIATEMTTGGATRMTPDAPAPGTAASSPVSLTVHDAPLLLAVGRLIPAKGFDLLLRAWQQVVARYPEWRLRIVGEGESRAALEALRDTLGIGHCVALPGTTPDILPHYRTASAFCLSSRYEGFGMVLIEAMACGLPIVSTDCPTGPREILEGTGAGLLVPPDNVDALAAALIRVLGDAALRTQLGRAGRQAAQRYHATTIAAAWDTLLCMHCPG